MNANAVAKHYASLTPEERFRLIVAAGARGDEAEQARLVAAGQHLTFSVRDHSPYSHAFDEAAQFMFIDLLASAADYLDSFPRADDAELPDEAEDDPEAAEAETDEGGDDAEAEDGSDDDLELLGDPRQRSIWQRSLELALAQGYLLKTRYNGWKLFCERLNLPPFAAWKGMPGFDRLQRGLQLAERAAFAPEGMVRWLNAIRPKDTPEVTVKRLVSAEQSADTLKAIFRRRVAWWGG